MSQLVTTHFVQQYTTNVQLLLQQKGSRLRGTIMEGAHVGEAAVPVDQIGKVAAVKRNSRYPDLTPQDTPTDRRWVYPVDYDWNDLIDNADKLRMLIDPQSSYVQNGTYSMGRAIDDELVAAFFGAAKTGKTGSTTTNFPAGQQIAANFGAAGNVGLTIAKLREAKRILLAAEVDVDNDPLTIAVTAKQHDDLLGQVQVASLDYNDRPVLVEGKVVRTLGFNLVHTERLATNGSGYRRCPAYAKSGMHLGIWNDIRTDVSQRKDKGGLPWQVYVYGTIGATRTDELRVVEIPCNES